MSWQQLRKWSARSGYLLLLLPVLLSTRRHDFHNSLTEMRYNAQTKAFEVEIKLFTDDLELALSRENGGRKFRIQDNDGQDAAVERYVRKHFKLSTPQGTPKPYTYVGKQNEVDATWIFVELPFAETLTGCRLQQSALTDVFDDQQNIVNLTFRGEKKYFLLNGKVPVRAID
jgi:hypothetical protein